MFVGIQYFAPKPDTTSGDLDVRTMISFSICVIFLSPDKQETKSRRLFKVPAKSKTVEHPNNDNSHKSR